MIWSYRNSKVRPVQDVEELCSELHVEILCYLPDVIVLVQRKVQVRRPRPDQDVAASVAAEIEALREGTKGRIAIRRVKGSRRRRRDREALSLDVVVRVSGIDEGPATRAGQTIRKGPGVAAVQSLRVPVGAEGGSKGYAVTYLVDGAHLPAIRDPTRGSWERFRGGDLPSSADHQGPADIEVGQAARRFQIGPEQARNRIRELVGSCCGRAGINALAPGERALELNTVAHPFLHCCFQGVVRRVTAKECAFDKTKIRVEDRSTPHR